MNTFTCGYRKVQGMDLEGSPFHIAGPNKDFWREDHTCSYCGSLDPEIALQRIAAQELVTPTDKTYKIYIGDKQKFYFYHFNEEQRQKFIDLYNLGPSRGMILETPGYFYVSPYFMRFRNVREDPSIS